MARKPGAKYASDEARRRKREPTVAIRCSIRNPDPERPEQAEVFGDATLRGVWLGLLTVAWQAWAGRAADRVLLTAGDVLWIGGVPAQGRLGRRIARRLAESEARLERVCHRMGYSVSSACHNGTQIWHVHVKNLQRNQLLCPANPTGPQQSESESSPIGEDLTPPAPLRGAPPQQLALPGTAAAAAKPPSKRRAAGVKSQAPEQLSAEQLEQVRAWAQAHEPWALAQLDELVAGCLRHFRASGKPMVDWALTAQNWVQRERTHFGRRQQPAAKGSRPRYAESDWDGRPPYSDEDDES